MRTLLVAGLCAVWLAHPAQADGVKLTTYGKWEVGEGHDFVDAFTTNGQGQRFGFNCSEECIGMVSSPYGCQDAQESVALFNSDEGAIALNLKCLVDSGAEFLTFQVDVSEAFKQKTDAAFAFPGIKATFVTMRFSLDGAAQAYAHVLRVFKKRQ